MGWIENEINREFEREEKERLRKLLKRDEKEKRPWWEYY